MFPVRAADNNETNLLFLEDFARHLGQVLHVVSASEAKKALETARDDRS